MIYKGAALFMDLQQRGITAARWYLLLENIAIVGRAGRLITVCDFVSRGSMAMDLRCLY